MWAGQILVGNGWAVYKGPAGSTEVHAHHALQLTICPRGVFAVDLPEVPGMSSQGILLASGERHSLPAQSHPLIFVYIEPMSRVGQAARELLCGRRYLKLDEQQVRQLMTGWPSVTGIPFAHSAAIFHAHIARTLFKVDTAKIEPGDARIAEALEHIRAGLDGRMRLSAVASRVNLSASHFSLLFRQQTGLPLRAYILWLRLQNAVAAFAAGGNATSAAHAAGFSDQAHFTRTFVRMFGVTPSTSLLRSEVIDAR